MLRASIVLAALACGCAPIDDDTRANISLTTPRALLECAAPPTDMAARMWISGSGTPCDLEVDINGGTTGGSCSTRPGLVRTLTIDWFTPRGGIDLVLAQARGALDLTTGDAAEAAFEVSDDDVVTADCLDMRDDQVDGSPVIEVNGAGVPVCDVDDSCAGGDGACSNLGELCAETDPFDAGDEP